MDTNELKSNVLDWFKELKFMQYIYLVIFTGIVMKYYLQSTTFEYEFSNVLYSVLRYALIGYIVANAVIVIVRKEYDSWLELVIMVMIIACSAAVAYTIHYDGLLDFALLLVGAKNIHWKKIAYMYLCVAVIIQILAYYASSIGIIADITLDVGKGVRHSLGINYPTDAASHFLFIMLVYATLREHKLTFIEIALMGIVSYWVYTKTLGRSNFICAIIMCGLLLLVKILYIFNIQLSRYKLLKVGGILMFLMVVGCIIGVTFYEPSSAIYQKLDGWLTGRIALSYKGLAQYGITAFGSVVEENHAVLGYYFFLDNSFIRIAISYGWVFLSLITYLYVLCFSKAVEYKKDIMIVALLVMLLAGIMEHHLVDIAYNPIWLMLFSCLGFEGVKGKGRGMNKARRTTGRGQD